MRQEIINLFKLNQKNNRIVFTPEIKVSRSRDTLYLYEIYAVQLTHAPTSYHVILEMGTGEKMTMALWLLDENSLNEIYKRLQGEKMPA